MQIKIKTRNHFKALSLFLDLPFYKIKNLILKDDLVLNIEHIQSIDHAKTNFAEIYYINYKNKHHHGQIILYDVDPKNFEEIKINEIKFDQDKHFRDFFLDFKFYLISPITINILYSIFFGFGFIKFSGLLFPEFEHPKLYTNAICNVECVTKTSNAMVALIFLLLMLIYQ